MRTAIISLLPAALKRRPKIEMRQATMESTDCRDGLGQQTIDTAGSSVPTGHHIVICLGQSLLKGGEVPPALELRVKHAASLHQRLASSGMASLYVSGADVAGGGKLTPEGTVMHDLLLRQGIAAGDIDVDTEAFNTIENAQNSIKAIQSRGATAVTLVTSDFHMPRAAYIFKTVLAAEGFSGLSFAVDPAPSGLAHGALRPQRARPREINNWNLLERLDHETQIMRNRMVAWLQEYGYQSRESHFTQAFDGLRSLGGSICREFVVGEQVRVRDHPEDPWTPGVVSSLLPMKVRCDGFVGSLTWEQVEHLTDTS